MASRIDLKTVLRIELRPPFLKMVNSNKKHDFEKYVVCAALKVADVSCTMGLLIPKMDQRQCQ